MLESFRFLRTLLRGLKIQAEFLLFRVYIRLLIFLKHERIQTKSQKPQTLNPLLKTLNFSEFGKMCPFAAASSCLPSDS